MPLIQSNQFFETQSPLEHYDESKTTLKMTTGSADLDSLTDAIQDNRLTIFFYKIGTPTTGGLD